MLDFNSLIFLNCVVNVVGVLMVAALLQRYGRKYRGLSLWFASLTAQAAGTALVLLRGIVPSVVTGVFANTLLVLGGLLLFIGLEQFVERRRKRTRDYIVFCLCAALLYFFSEIEPNFAARSIVVSSLLVVYFGQAAYVLLFCVSGVIKEAVFVTGVVVAGYAVVSALRIAILAAFPGDVGIVHAGVADAMAITTYLTLHICLLMSLALALSRRLLDEVLCQEAKFAKVFHSVPCAIVISRRSNGSIVEVNEIFCRLFGCTREEALGRKVSDLGFGSICDAEGSLPVTGTGAGREISILSKSGEPMIGKLVSDALVIGEETCVLASIDDFTGEHLLRRRLQELATKDDLTGLPNRRYYYERFAMARQGAERTQNRMAVMLVDVDKFKAVNDDYGHAAGDAVLIETAQRLIGCVREGDVVARFGGDEFAVLLVDVSLVENVIGIARRMIDAARVPFAIPGRDITVSLSIGMAVFPDDGREPDELIASADRSLYSVKNSGRNGCRMADPPKAP